jgi:hypothetical protein
MALTWLWLRYQSWLTSQLEAVSRGIPEQPNLPHSNLNT